MPWLISSMRSDRSRDALTHIRENLLLAQSFVQDLDFPGFAADARSRYAVIRCLEIISEASRRVSEEARLRHPHLPWSQIAAAGNIYRHEYEEVRSEVLWRTIHDALPHLLVAVESELARDQDVAD